jgi:hypothetical protein
VLICVVLSRSTGGALGRPAVAGAGQGRLPALGPVPEALVPEALVAETLVAGTLVAEILVIEVLVLTDSSGVLALAAGAPRRCDGALGCGDAEPDRPGGTECPGGAERDHAAPHRAGAPFLAVAFRGHEANLHPVPVPFLWAP